MFTAIQRVGLCLVMFANVCQGSPADECGAALVADDVSGIGRANEPVFGYYVSRAVDGFSASGRLQLSQDVVEYMNLADLLTKNSAELRRAVDQIHDEVLYDGKTYLIDATGLTSSACSSWHAVFGISFPEDMFLVSQYQNALMYTPFYKDQVSSSDFEALVRHVDLLPEKRNRLRRFVSSSEDQEDVPEYTRQPVISFFLNVYYPFTKEQCTFPGTYHWGGIELLCHNANISLVYRVNMTRSRSVGGLDNATPDANIVRITVDDESFGAGIHLNDSLSYHEHKHLMSVRKLNDWYQDWSTDVHALYYRFKIGASNDKATILKTFPYTNINPETSIREASEFETGASASAGVSSSPKAELGGSFSIKRTRQLSYDTNEYRVEKSNPDNKTVAFTWQRENNRALKSLIFKWTDIKRHASYPVAHKRMSSISYNSFSPRFDVVYMADPDETGSTTFAVDASVMMRPLYTSSYLHYYFFGYHVSYHGMQTEHLNRLVTATKSFKVDWNNPVFLGAHPVNLQLGGFNNKCIEIAENGKVIIGTCDLFSKTQSFVYDRLTRFRSAGHSDLCLDGDRLDQLTPCSLNLSQRWRWVPDSDLLENQQSFQILTHDTNTNRLNLLPAAVKMAGGLSNRTITSFTRIFSLSSVDGDVRKEQGRL